MIKANEREVAQAHSSFASLLREARLFYEDPERSPEKEKLVRRTISEFEILVCKLVARYVLYHTMTPWQRQTALRRIGFTTGAPFYSFGRDKWVGSLILTTALTFLVLFFWPALRPQSLGEMLLRAFSFAVQIAIAILLGAAVARYFLRRVKYGGSSYPPLFHLTIAAVMALALSAVVRGLIPLVPGVFHPRDAITLADAWDSFRSRAPALIYPVLCTYVTGLLFCYVATSSLSRARQAAVGALCMAATFACAGVLFWMLLSNKTLGEIFNDTGPALFSIVVTSILLGAPVGALVLLSFGAAAEAREAEDAFRKQAFAASMSNGGDSSLLSPSSTVGASREVGAYLRHHVEDLEGRYVCFRPVFRTPEIINAYEVMIEWDEKRSCLTFQESGRADRAYTQSGLVYVPYGKPFMNLMTADQGDVRVMTLCRPSAGVARGLVLTLSNPAGMHFTPASTPVVLQRVDVAAPSLGFIRPGEPGYEAYRAELQRVTPEFGLLVQVPSGALEASVARLGEGARLTVVG